MLNPIKEIYDWQFKAGNLDNPYDDFLESSFQIEEALEGFVIPAHGWTIDETQPKALARQIVTFAQMENCSPISDVDRLDKACDAVIFAIGSMAKLGLDHQGITKALNIVNRANQAKLGMERDAAGKLLKPENFSGPEPELQALLDKRSIND